MVSGTERGTVRGLQRPPITAPDPATVAASRLTAFMAFCARETGLEFPDHQALDRFSVAEHSRFWGLFLAWSGLIVEGSAEPVCTSDDPERAAFFPGLRLNYVENLLG